VIGQWDLVQSCEAVLRLTEKHPRARIKLIEAKANGPAVMALLRQRTGGLVPVTPTASKTVRVVGDGSTEALRGGRAVTFGAAVQAGDVYLPHPDLYPWVRDVRGALGRFPRSGKDDTDSASQAWAYYAGPSWLEIDRAHLEALKRDSGPRDTRDVLRQMTRAALKKKAPPKGKAKWYRRR
jgi:predicted phage terminase large subunit-like protein